MNTKLGSLALLLLVGCKPSLETRNNEPSVTVVYPLAGDELVEGYTTVFRGSVTDTNHHPEDLVAAWLLGGEELCAEAPIADDGTSLCEAVLDVGDATVTLLARDPQDAEGSEAVDLSVRANGAPTVEILAPDPAGPWFSDEYVVFEAIVSDDEDAPGELTLAWTDGAGAAVDLDVAADSDGALSGAIRLEPGTHTFTLTATDRPGSSGQASVTLEVAER